MIQKKNKFNARVIFNVFAILLFVFLLLGILMPIIEPHGTIPPKVKCRVELEDLGIALNAYHDKYGVFPNGKQSEIVKSLLGENPQKYQFLNINFNNLNSNREYLDPWKTPYVIYFSPTNSFVISSAGKDKIFGDADDIIFNSVSNGFVKP